MSNIDVAKNTCEAFARGNMETVLGSMDPNMEWREAEEFLYKSSRESWAGPEKILIKK